MSWGTEKKLDIIEGIIEPLNGAAYLLRLLSISTTGVIFLCVQLTVQLHTKKNDVAWPLLKALHASALKASLDVC